MRRSVRFLATLAAVLCFGFLLRGAGLRLLPIIRGADAGGGQAEKPSDQTAAGVSGPSARLLAAQTATGATVQTDRSDYFPGENVVITGSGWQAGEVVSLELHEDPPIDTHPTLYATADNLGNIFNNEFYTDFHDIGITFTLTATGPISGQATTTFTDSPASLDQCTNGGVGDPPEQGKHFNNAGNWVNGDANGQKSHWREGDFISYRDTIAVDEVGSQPQTNVFQIHYDTVVGGKHALDYLGDFDATETTSPTSTAFHFNNNDPCGDIIFGCNPAIPDSQGSIPSAALAVSCGGSSSTFTGSQIAGSFKIWGNNSPLITGVAYAASP